MHSAHLLNAIYNSSKTDDIKDITVEDPNIDFRFYESQTDLMFYSHLRNLTDATNLQKEGYFKEPSLEPLEQETIEEIRSKMKLHEV